MEQGPSSQVVAYKDGDDSNDGEGPIGPLFVNGEYVEANHYKMELARVKRDLNLPKIVESLGEDVCNFVEIESKFNGVELHVTYHPNPAAELGDGYKWLKVNAAVRKNASKLYKQASNKRIQWYTVVIEGDIMELISGVFEDDIMNCTYKTDLKAFVRKVAKFITQCPYKQATSFGCYVTYFLDLIQTADNTMTKIELFRLGKAIILEFKRFLDFKDKNLPESDMARKLWETKTLLTIVDCSKAVEYRISLIDLNAQKANRFFEELEKESEQQLENEKAEKQARIAAAKNARANQSKAIEAGPSVANKKRPREPVEIKQIQEDGDDTAEEKDKADEPESKKRKLEE